MNRKLNEYRIKNTKQQASAVLVEFSDYKDRVMRVAGILRVPTMRSRNILLQADHLGQGGPLKKCRFMPVLCLRTD
jgi:hypothetical protein